MFYAEAGRMQWNWGQSEDWPEACQGVLPASSMRAMTFEWWRDLAPPPLVSRPHLPHHPCLMADAAWCLAAAY
jgi:hypothetical protein